ncbi:S-adenosyl-L-methionine-dependent methyltransferase [Syncephalis plumigaleata]|nr:S-adenosyl-L-methionine-dependent methyltransferase [Syncephalis plumigaleata]
MIAATATTATPTHQRRISVAHTFSQFVGTLKKQRTIRRRQTVMGFGRHVHDADTLHVAMMTALHGTHAAILQQPRRILNVATGTGVWIKDTANKYPMTEFTGIDLIEQHFDTHTPLASNCILAKGNIVQGLPYPNTYFDYIYQRDMALDVANAEIEWLSAFKEMYRMLLPGGLIEIIECDLQITGKSQASRKLNGLITTAAARHKLGVGRVATIDRRLVSTGFHDITRTIRQLRMGKWAGLEGICAKRYYRARVEHLFPFIQTLGVTVEELNAMLQELEEECDTKHHVHLQLYCYLAYRPSDENGNNSSHIDMESSASSIITSNAVVLSSSSKLRPPAEVLTKRVRKGFQVLRNSWSWPRSGTAPHHILSSLAVHHQRVYLIPRCTEELERLDSQHNMLLHFLGTLCMAPITQPKRVLDLGTGTGGWVKSMAEEYPFCEIHGCDNDEEIMPTASISPQCSFQYGDIMKGLPYPDGYFDYVYQRQMLLAFPATNDGWPTIGLEWQRILSHGGHIELVETDHLLRSIGPQGDQLNDWFKRLCEHHAIQVDMPQTLRSILRKSKFERVRDQTLPCPLGEWGGRIGNTHQQTYRQFILGLAMHFTAIGVTRIMLEQALDALEKETEQTKGFINIYIAWGRKPSPKPESTPPSASKEDKPLPQLPAQMVE